MLWIIRFLYENFLYEIPFRTLLATQSIPLFYIIIAKAVETNKSTELIIKPRIKIEPVLLLNFLTISPSLEESIKNSKPVIIKTTIIELMVKTKLIGLSGGSTIIISIMMEGIKQHKATQGENKSSPSSLSLNL